MTINHFIVALHDSQWKVSYHGTEQGPFANKEEAVELAIRGAQEEREAGREVEVLVQDIESNFHRAWPMREQEEEEGLSSTA